MFIYWENTLGTIYCFRFDIFIMTLRATWGCYESRKARGEKEEKEKDE